MSFELIDSSLYNLTELGLPDPPKDGPAILLYDIETAASLVHTWTQWQTNVIDTVEDWYILCFAFKWLGQRKVRFVRIGDPPNDFSVAERLAALYDRADIVVAHNGNQFDQRKANVRFLLHGITPPSPYQEIDTLRETKRSFNHYSSALKELGRFHSLGSKMPHTGFDLWRGCMDGDPAKWRLMEKYNRQDVVLLERLYLRLRPWIGRPGKAAHPNLGFWSRGEDTCPKCGKVGTLIRRGTRHRGTVNEYVSLQCSPARKGCGGYTRSRRPLKFGEDEKVGAV